MENETTKKRYLVKIIVQPIFIEIDEDGNCDELVTQPSPIPAREFMVYAQGLMELGKQPPDAAGTLDDPLPTPPYTPAKVQNA